MTCQPNISTKTRPCPCLCKWNASHDHTSLNTIHCLTPGFLCSLEIFLFSSIKSVSEVKVSSQIHPWLLKLTVRRLKYYTTNKIGLKLGSATQGLGYLSQGPHHVNICIWGSSLGASCSQRRPNQQSQWSQGKILLTEWKWHILAKTNTVLYWLTQILLWDDWSELFSCRYLCSQNTYPHQQILPLSIYLFNLYSCYIEMTSNNHSQAHRSTSYLKSSMFTPSKADQNYNKNNSHLFALV